MAEHYMAHLLFISPAVNGPNYANGESSGENLWRRQSKCNASAVQVAATTTGNKEFSESPCRFFCQATVRGRFSFATLATTRAKMCFSNTLSHFICIRWSFWVLSYRIMCDIFAWFLRDLSFAHIANTLILALWIWLRIFHLRMAHIRFYLYRFGSVFNLNPPKIQQHKWNGTRRTPPDPSDCALWSRFVNHNKLNMNARSRIKKLPRWNVLQRRWTSWRQVVRTSEWIPLGNEQFRDECTENCEIIRLIRVVFEWRVLMLVRNWMF